MCEIEPQSQLFYALYTSASALLQQDHTYYEYSISSQDGEIELSIKPHPETHSLVAYVDANNDFAPSAGEPYSIYDNQTQTGTPIPFVFSAGALIDVVFSDENLRTE